MQTPFVTRRRLRAPPKPSLRMSLSGLPTPHGTPESVLRILPRYCRQPGLCMTAGAWDASAHDLGGHFFYYYYYFFFF